MPVTFSASAANNGFDAGATPNWQMVPKGGARLVHVAGASGMTLSSSNTSVAVVFDVPIFGTNRLIAIVGIADGTAQIRLSNAAGVQGRLDVDVKNKRTVKVSFNFVSDNSSTSTSRSHSEVANYITQMNAIYFPQTNIEVRQLNVRDVRVNRDLRRVVRFSSHLSGIRARQHEWDHVVAHADGGADFNVFFVWEYEQDRTPHVDNTDAGTLGSNCIFEDAAGTQVGETLAHEMGHFLGVDDHYNAARIDELMYGITDTRGTRIPKAHANTMNP